MGRLGLIQAGVGGHGKAWFGPVANSGDFHLLAIADPAPDALRQAGEALGIPPDRRFLELREALDTLRPDAVLSVTPPRVHVEHARLTLPRGIHLLVEKPLAHDPAGAREMEHLSRNYGAQLAVAQNYRFSPPVRTLHRLLRDRPPGTLTHGTIEFFIPADFSGTFRASMDHPLLVDMAIHHVDMLRYLTGADVVQVRARESNPPGSWFRTGAILHLFLSLSDGSLWSYAGDWTARGKCTPWNGNWRFQFTGGSVHLVDDRIELHTCEPWMNNPRSESIPVDPYPADGKIELLAQFAQAIRTGTRASTDVSDNIRSFEAIMAAVSSADRDGEPVLL
jgi:predicted dehydrogenase